MNDMFKAEEEIANLKQVPSEKRSELQDELNSLFEHSQNQMSDEKSKHDELANENVKMRQELKKAREMIDTGID